MGQAIKVEEPIIIGDVALFATDRGFTGQDGRAFGEPADPGSGVPARLATAVFAADGAIEHVYVASNQVVARRSGGWEGDSVAGVAAAIERFGVFYGGA